MTNGHEAPVVERGGTAIGRATEKGEGKIDETTRTFAAGVTARGPVTRVFQARQSSPLLGITLGEVEKRPKRHRRRHLRMLHLLL